MMRWVCWLKSLLQVFTVFIIEVFHLFGEVYSFKIPLIFEAILNVSVSLISFSVSLLSYWKAIEFWKFIQYSTHCLEDWVQWVFLSFSLSLKILFTFRMLLPVVDSYSLFITVRYIPPSSILYMICSFYCLSIW